MTRLIQVQLCVNDPRNGEPSGYCLGLDVIDASGDVALELATVTMDSGPVCRIEHKLGWQLKLGYFWFPVKRHATWVGNMCWDAVWLEPRVAADLLNKARASRWWTLESGYSPYFERWDSHEPFTAELFDIAERMADGVFV